MVNVSATVQSTNRMRVVCIGELHLARRRRGLSLIDSLRFGPTHESLFQSWVAKAHRDFGSALREKSHHWDFGDLHFAMSVIRSSVSEYVDFSIFSAMVLYEAAMSAPAALSPLRSAIH